MVMDKPNDSVTSEQRAELFELYKEHAEAMLRAGQAMQQEGMGARFIEEDGKASEIFRRVQDLRNHLGLYK
jgi:hypothetical protein